MKRKPATGLFLLGYLVVTLVGSGLYVVKVTAMWAMMFMLMPVVFACLAYTCYRKSRSSPAYADIVQLGGYWILLSFLLDAAIYIAVLPVALGVKPHWTFFVDQSPWIWMAYASLMLTVTVGFFAARVHSQTNTAV